MLGRTLINKTLDFLFWRNKKKWRISMKLMMHVLNVLFLPVVILMVIFAYSFALCFFGMLFVMMGADKLFGGAKL